ncbi:MAG: sensor histidine kinase, partial [Pirellulaceae bacterium]|nr:sensor histidine kinase [Pirellulaceae bacterium]
MLRLRWAAVIGQVATIAVTTTVLGVDLQLPPLITIVGLTAVTNALAARSLRDQVRREEGPLFGPTGDRWLATLMALDMLSLTGLLYYTGGPENPFTMFYFVNLALSAVVLPAVWSWLLTSLAVSASIGLFFVHVELPELRDANQSEMSIREIGFLVALAGCAVVVVHFITRVTTALHLREAQLREAEEKRQASRRLDSLATLAAGAGHELASPLSTIAVVAKELSMHLEGVDVPETVVRDVALIRS